ncbi:MAG: alpha/beta hydrolase [Elainellaceae cyanobacterium]
MNSRTEVFRTKMVTLNRLAAALLVALLGNGLLGSASSASLEPGKDRVQIEAAITPRRCPVALPVGETADETLTCGILTVPENYHRPQARQIEISYIVLHSNSPDPAPDPVVHLVGGPGGSAIESLDYRTDIFDTLRRSRDIVLFDQRGAQYSSRLDCQPYFQRVAAQREGDEVAARFAELEAQNPDAPLGILEAQAAMGACAEGLQRSGVDLTQYNSVNNVRDILALVGALGYESFNLYGISYGTRLALTVMRDAPQNLRSAVLDSAYPVHINNYENTTNLNEEVVLGLLADCAADVACATAYPDLEARLRQVLARVEEAPIALEEPVELFFRDSVVSQVTPAVMRLLVSRFLDGYPWFAPYFPRVIYELHEGDTTTLELALSGALRDGPASAVAPNEPAVLTAEDMQSQDEATLREERRVAFRQRPGFSWLNDLYDLATELPEPLSEAALFDLDQLPASARDITVLADYVENFFQGEEAAELLAALNALPPDEIRSIFEIISDLNNADTTEGMHYSVECHEEFRFNNRDRAQAIYNALRFPLLGEAGWTVTNQATAVCDVWPSGAARPIENAVVMSDIPTLIMSGVYDSQTPPSWNRLAAEGLTNSYFVSFPNTGHGVIGYSQCAEDIAAAFLENPAIAPEASCTEDLRPEFVVDRP